jgi:YD repeat-containing protein
MSIFLQTDYERNMKRSWKFIPHNDHISQMNSQTAFEYDKRSLLKKKTDPLLKETRIYYDDAGGIDYKIDRKNDTVDYTLTPTGKPDWIYYPSGPSIHFIYNQLDQLQTMQDGIGNTGYAYWRTGRLQSVTNPYGFAVSYAYDEAGNLKEITYPGNKKVIYEYDDLNRLWKVKIDWLNPSNPPTATYNYDAGGRLTGVTNFNGTLTSYGYDNANRLTSIENKKSDLNVIAAYSFTLDGNGNRIRVEQIEPLELPIPLGFTQYSYNAKKNRLLTAGTESFGYDDEGQLSTGYGVSYTFDYEHRLTGIGSSDQFYYDGAGNRLQATRSGVTTRYIYDAAGNLLAEADGSNTILRYFVHGLGLLAMVTPSNQVYCYHFNAVGSTIAMTDQNQTVVNKYAYDPFGEILAQEEAFLQPFKFVGQFGVMTEPMDSIT